MTAPYVILGARDWWGIVAAVMTLALLLITWSYVRARSRRSVRLACAVLKALAFASLVFMLLEPLLIRSRPRRGANAFAVLVDNSQSLLIHDDNAAQSRGDWIRDRLSESAWKTRLGQDFDVRNYVFDSTLRSVDGFDTLAFEGTDSSLGTSLTSLSRRFHGLPLAGILLFTDGNRTDLGDVDCSSLPPVYPVVPPTHGKQRDVGVRDVSVSQTNFEAAPVVLRADIAATGFSDEPIVVAVVDESGKVVERQQATSPGDNKLLNFRFQFRPERKGVNFYAVRAFPASEDATAQAGAGAPSSSEQILANNSRLVVVDQGGGPYRILYLSGRPNWEFKFLRRALFEDEQIQLVGLLRIARRQPRFDFQSSARDRTISPLYSGFDHPDADTAERADQAVLVRLGTLDEEELRDGFPKSAEELYRYHAIIIDDLEAAFFTQDQLALLRSFVSARGGGLLMLGGPDSFADGAYDRTPVGELLPVYLNSSPPVRELGSHRLVLTREGWLQPWVRTRKTEDEERKRLAAMPEFQTLSSVGRIKPGAVTLAELTDEEGQIVPALVSQTFGKGHVAALLIGDLWRWAMRRAHAEETDFERSWRQTARWLVSDVPGRVDLSIRPKADSSTPGIEIAVRVRDAEYRPLDNAKVGLKVTLPDKTDLNLGAEPVGREAGLYAATYVTKLPGAYRIVATAAGVDGAIVGKREVGWAAQPIADEFARLTPDHDFLAALASKTGGEVVDPNRLDAFISSLPSRGVPITEQWASPLWHHPLYLLIAILCLSAEWGLRRVNGLA
jgi:uncharacterized membrane protein